MIFYTISYSLHTLEIQDDTLEEKPAEQVQLQYDLEFTGGGWVGAEGARTSLPLKYVFSI